MYWDDVMKVASKLMLRYWNGVSFWTNSQNIFYTHAKPMGLFRYLPHALQQIYHALIFRYIDWSMCIMIPQYNTVPLTRLHRVLCVCKTVFNYLSEKDSHFFTSTSILMPLSPNPPKVLHFVNIFKKFIIFSHLWEIQMLKSVKLILNHSVCLRTSVMCCGFFLKPPIIKSRKLCTLWKAWHNASCKLTGNVYSVLPQKEKFLLWQYYIKFNKVWDWINRNGSFP